MVYSNLSGTTSKKFSIGSGKATEKSLSTTDNGLTVINKDGDLVPLSVGEAVNDNDALTKAGGVKVFATKEQGEKADTAIQAIEIGVVEKGETAKASTSNEGNKTILNLTLPQGDPGKAGSVTIPISSLYARDSETLPVFDFSKLNQGDFLYIDDYFGKSNIVDLPDSHRYSGATFFVNEKINASGNFEEETEGITDKLILISLRPSSVYGGNYFYSESEKVFSENWNAFDERYQSILPVPGDIYIYTRWIGKITGDDPTHYGDIYKCLKYDNEDGILGKSISEIDSLLVNMESPLTISWVYSGSCKGEAGEQGPQGDPGVSAGFGVPTATIQSVEPGSPASVSIDSSGPDTAKVFAFTFGIPKGEKGEQGDQGIQGPAGQDGVKGDQGDPGTPAGFGTPTASATTLQPGAQATVEVEASGSDTSKIFAFTFGIPKGEKGDKGDTGEKGEKGDTGSQGPTGAAAGFGTPTASVSSLEPGSNPTVSVNPSGPNTAKIFAFNFGIPKGEKGDQGIQGPAGQDGEQGPKGEQGDPGTPAGFGTPTATATALAAGATPTVSINPSGPNTAKIFAFNFGIPKGEKGDQGIQGPAGQDGAKGDQGDPGVAAGFGVPTASATTLEPGQNATVSVKASGSNTAKVFAFTFGIPKGAKGEKGDQGIQGPAGQDGAKGDQGDPGTPAGFGTPTATVSTLSSGENATATVKASGPNTAKVFAFNFGIPKGEKGEKGDPGDTGPQGQTGTAAGFGTPTASASSLEPGSNPTVSVNPSGPNTAKIFAFNFGIPKGEKGDQGIQGPAGQDGAKGDQGDPGTPAGFGTPTATASVLDAGATPTVSVSPSGPDTAKVFAFNFGIPKGEKGDTGPNSLSSSTTVTGFTNGYALYVNNGKVGAKAFPESSTVKLDSESVTVEPLP